VAKILEDNNGFDIAPSSGKVVVFDNRLLIKDALLGLIEQDLKCGIIIDRFDSSLMNIITVTDFIYILLHFYESTEGKSVAEEIENLTINKWLEITGRKKQTIKFIQVEDNLFKGVKILKQSCIRRLPVMQDEGDKILCILNHQRILRFVIRRYLQSFTSRSALLKIKLGDLVKSGLGNFSDYPVANINEPIVNVLTKIQNNLLPCIPLTDDNGDYVDSFTSSDVRYLALDGNYKNLDISTKTALGDHHNRFYSD